MCSYCSVLYYVPQLLVIAALPVLGTGYPVAITRVPGPGFKFSVSKEK